MVNEINYSEKYDVFLSYRRDGGETMAVLLHDRLVAKGYSVFLDIESLNSGSFNNKLLSVIENCTDVVVVCSKGSLDRCNNEGDWVRMEIAHALKNGKNVVPIFLRDFKWPDILPDDMEALRVQNGVNANSTEYFDAAVDRLAGKFLQSAPQASATKKTTIPKQPKVKKPLSKKTKGILAVALSLVVVVGVVFGGMALWGKKGNTNGAGSVQNKQNSNSTYDKGIVINGVKWATRNVDKPGTFAANPEDAGMLYQWNRKKAWATTGEVGWDTGWEDYDGITAWEKANDPSPIGWHVPTLDEIKTLFDTDKVNNEWTSINGINGRKFIDRANGSFIFLPSVCSRSSRDGSILSDAGLVGSYWSSTKDHINEALYMRFDSSDTRGWCYDCSLDAALSVRPAAE